ncbi:peptidase inhibitor family I36 protein [Saccharopolyspora gloriosae]|uniref:peptidase inhibitor family I36 protein n=1 Tax=Saccharopolyspora gloriosae TaxID=455344 RepID=UPI001FB5C4E7|nr:peptidase inhibitor family I36 protein [Saccharopolyspora gloriosae]
MHAAISKIRTTRPQARPLWISRRAVLAPVLAAGIALSALGGTVAQAGPAEPIPCLDGAFCAYPHVEYQGEPHRAELRTTALEECVALPPQPETKSFVNQTGKPVTVYQDPTCDTHADFSTYPPGSFVPRSDYVARAIKVWSR